MNKEATITTAGGAAGTSIPAELSEAEECVSPGAACLESSATEMALKASKDIKGFVDDPSHNSANSVDPLVASADKKKNSSAIMWPYYLGFAVVCLLAVAAIIIASVLSATRRNDDEITTTISRLEGPLTGRETGMIEQLELVVGADIVSQGGSSHKKALNWILYQDPMQLDEFSANLIQRYTLALFYYQTTEQGLWLSCNPPIDEENDTCIYQDIKRDKQTNELYYENREEIEVRWLSENHECEWVEVLCDPVSEIVTAIDMRGNNLTGTLPEELMHLDKLEWLTLSFNGFIGTIPEVYGEFQQLQIFELTECLISGHIPSGFYQMQDLLQLNLVSTLISGTIPPEIGNWNTLHSLFMFNTLLEGTIPTEIGGLGNVRDLWLYDNEGLFGPIPSEIGKLSRLETLKLANNGHSGPLPSEMGILSNNMQEFLFANNDMDGTTIPEEIWNMTSLIFFDIDGSGFGGTISTNIGKMANLKGLKAARNSFGGTVPSEVGLLDHLELLWVHVNEKLGGEMPIEVCQLRGQSFGLQFLQADCAGTDPQMECICCTACCDEYAQCQIL